MDPGTRIERYDELLKVCSNPSVQISRRALKHFVERRKGEMWERYPEDEVIARLFFAIDNIGLTVQRHDSREEEDNKLVYGKYFDNEYKSSLKVVMESVQEHWEIKSIHFKKNKKATH